MNTNETVKVWVMEHDDPEVTFVINSLSDMEENFDDMINENSPTVLIVIGRETFPYDPARVLKGMDKVLYDSEFMRYRQGWTELEMPMDLFLSDNDSERISWVASQLGAE